jgi:large subunit ribosomal protein L20
MPRAVSNVPRLKRKKGVMKAGRGAFGARSKLWKATKENVERGWKYAYRDRKNKKRDFRRLWIQRINAAAHQNDLNYNQFMNGLKEAGIEVNRKILADLAVHDPAAFTALADKARSALNAA